MMMMNDTNTTTTGNLPISNPKQSSPASTPSSSGHSSNMSPLAAVLCLLVLIAIPALIYAFFFAINCPPIQLRRPRRRQRQADGDLSSSKDGKETELVTAAGGVKYTKEGDHEEEYGSECPVCLSAFVEGDLLRQLSGCKHSFHVACIDKWLCTHSNCPVCRASVPSLAPNGRLKRPAQRAREDDFTQGLPDAASLV